MEERLSDNELLWLYTRGGRTAADVRIDHEGNLYVWMAGGDDGAKAVYIPTQLPRSFRESLGIRMGRTVGKLLRTGERRVRYPQPSPPSPQLLSPEKRQLSPPLLPKEGQAEPEAKVIPTKDGS